jgi:excisionase family DNA binding protein
VGAVSAPYLTVADVAKRRHCSVRVVHEATRMRALPFRRFGRRCLFVESELDAFESGELPALEVIELDGGGVVVRAVKPARGRRS